MTEFDVLGIFNDDIVPILAWSYFNHRDKRQYTIILHDVTNYKTKSMQGGKMLIFKCSLIAGFKYLDFDTDKVHEFHISEWTFLHIFRRIKGKKQFSNKSCLDENHILNGTESG